MSELRTRLDANQVLRNSYDDEKDALRVLAEVTASIGELDLAIDAAAGDNIAIANQDGTEFAEITNGALHVILDDNGQTTKNICQEVTGVVSGVTVQILSYTALANTKIISCDFGGTNIAIYSLYIGSDLAAKKYTYFQSLNERFDFGDGLPVNVGDVITIEAVHTRPNPGDFVSNLLIKN